jgi:hypothetical protein
MADIYSHMPPTGPVFTSKSRPFNSPLGHQPSQHHLHSPTPALAHSSIHSQLPNFPLSSTTPQRPSLKRTRSDDEDDAMDGSPTPADRRVLASAKGRKLASIKRLRVETISGESPGRTRPKGTEEKREEETAEDEVDAGVLLGVSISRFLLVVPLLIVSCGLHTPCPAGLPASSHLPLLQALLAQMPQIKPTLLSLIPRPTAETTRDAILDAVKKLREAVPYSATLSTSFPSTPQLPGTPTGASSNSLGLGFAFGAATASTPSFTVGAAASLRPSPTPQQRDSYVLNRLRPAVQTFTTTVASYLPYFSLVPAPVTLASLQQRNRQPQQPHLNSKPPSHSETFTVLSTLTSSLLTLPPAAAQALKQHSDLHSRVVAEWKAWLHSLDNHVNREGGIFGRDMVQSWLTALEAFSVGKPASTGHALGSGLAFGTNWLGGGRSGLGSPTMSSTGEWGTPLASPGGLGFRFGSAVAPLVPSPALSSMHNKDLMAQMKEVKDDWISRVGWLAGRHAPPQDFDPMEEQ